MATRKFHKNLEKLKGVVSMNFSDFESIEFSGYIYNSSSGELVDTSNLSTLELFELLTNEN